MARPAGSWGGAFHDGDFLRRQAVEGVNLLGDLALQGAGVGGGVFSTNGAGHASPGQRPGFGEPRAFSPVGAGHRAAGGLGRPFRAWSFGVVDPGRCPGLVWGRAFGPQEQAAEGEAWRRVHLAAAWTRAFSSGVRP